MTIDNKQTVIDDIHANEGDGRKSLWVFLRPGQTVLFSIVTTIEGVQYSVDHDYADSFSRLQALEPVPADGSEYASPPQLPNDSSGRTVSSETDTVTDTYVVDSEEGFTLSVPAGKPITEVYATINSNAPKIRDVATTKSEKLNDFSEAVKTYVDGYYDFRNQFRFFVLYQTALNDGLTNRAAYIKPLIDWLHSILSYSATFTMTVMGMSDAAQIDALQWDFTQIPPPSNVTLVGAVSIQT